MKQSDKLHHLLQTIHHSKPILAILSLLLSLLLVIGSTYSWFTYSDEKINRTRDTVHDLNAEIKEVFRPEYAWAPGIDIKKEVSVRNTGDMPAIVRLSLFESWGSFECDLNDRTGNGNLGLTSTPSTTLVSIDNVQTWQTGNTFKIHSGEYWTVADQMISDTTVSTDAYKIGNARTKVLEYVTIDLKNMESTVPTTPTPIADDTWYYDDGYFYYSSVLSPGEESKLLVQKIQLANNLPNRYKGALYKLTPVMDAHEVSSSLVTDWQLSPDIQRVYNGKY